MFNNLRAEIARKGWSQGALCELLGMSRTTFSMKVNGKTEFTVTEAMRIKDVLATAVPIEELFDKGIE